MVKQEPSEGKNTTQAKTAPQTKPASQVKQEQKPKIASGPPPKAAGAPAQMHVSHTNVPPTDEIPRGTFCDRLPRHHQASACHQTSQQRKAILTRLKRLVDEAVNAPVCPEWDTQSTLNNTPGPYRFGVYQPIPVFDQDAIKTNELIGSQMIHNCDCLKRNGLQDDCRRLDCRGKPECLVTPFPQCEPFWNLPPRNRSGFEGYECNQPDSQCLDYY